MKVCRALVSIGMLINLAAAVRAPSAIAQTATPTDSQPVAAGLRKLTGDDAKRAAELDTTIETDLEADRWGEAITKGEELLALLSRALGRKHFETVNVEWRLKALRRLAAMSKEDRARYISAKTMKAQAEKLYVQGDRAQARRLLEQVVQIHHSLLGDDDPGAAACYRSLAYVLGAQGDHAAATTLLEKALEIHRRLLTDNHPLTVMSYRDLASGSSARGRHAEAQPLFEKILEILRRELSDDHPEIPRAYTNLAMNLTAQGKYAQAQIPCEKALEINLRLLGPEHRDTATSYNNLGINLGRQGKHSDAEPYLKKALEIHRRLFGDNHADTANSYNSVAAGLNAMGRYSAAQPLFEKALEINRRLLTDNHPVTATSFSNLAVNLDKQTKYTEAEPHLKTVLEIRRRLLGENHVDTAASYNNLAANLVSQSRCAEAQPFLEKALEIRRRLLTDDHPDTAGSYNNLAYNLDALGKYAEAQPLFEKALEIRRRLLSDRHPDTATSFTNLASNLGHKGKFIEAGVLYEQALQIHMTHFGDEHVETAQSYNNVAYNLNEQRRYVEAQPLYEKSLRIRLKLLHDEHPSVAKSYNNLASNLSAQGKHALAQPLFEKSLEIRRRLLKGESRETAAGYHNLALNLNAQGKYEKAHPLHEKAIEITERLFGENHPDCAVLRAHLAANLYAQGRLERARDEWIRAARILDVTRLDLAFTGLERAFARASARPSLAAVEARLGQPADAWRTLEEDLGRGLLDELAVRRDDHLPSDDRARLRELSALLERLDRIVESDPKDLGETERLKRFERLKHEREVASVALGELRTKLMTKNGPLAGRVATLEEVQAALPADAALIAWVDVRPYGLGGADPDSEHWGMVVRASGVPDWVALRGSGSGGRWTDDDAMLAERTRTAMRSRPTKSSSELAALLQRLRAQRLDPLAGVLGPTIRRMIVLPSRGMAGIPVESLQAPDDTRIVSYAPSATVFKYLREQAHPDRRSGFLALGDPAYGDPDRSRGPAPLPDHGLLVNMAAPGSNAAAHGVKAGDVLLAYNGIKLRKKDDLKVVMEGHESVAVEVWRDAKSSTRKVSTGKLGVVLDSRPAPEALAANRAITKVLMAARGQDEEFAALPGTRYEVETLARLFKSDDRPIQMLLERQASEPELERIAAAGELGRYGFIHLATHGVIDEDVPARSAIILAQTGLPDPLEQALAKKPVFDGRLSVREIQHDWELKAELVTMSACETALGRDLGGEGYVGFTQALLISGARSVCLSLWKVDDTATALLMQRFYGNLLGRRAGRSAPMPKAEALREAKIWLRGLRRAEVLALTAELSGGIERGKGAKGRAPATIPGTDDNDRPYESPHYWAAFVLSGDPD